MISKIKNFLFKILYKKKVAPTLANVKKGDKFDLYIGRRNVGLNLPESKWGNPFKMKNESERTTVVAKYKEYILSRQDLIKSLPELGGKVLGCYCYNSEKGEGKLCHGSVLIELYEKLVLLKK